MAQKTCFYDYHIAAGAKMSEFAGFEMPIMYQRIQDEHMMVRTNAGMFDVSHMGEFVIEGPQAKDLVQWLTTNDVEKLFPGRVQYSCLSNEQGGAVDDLLVYCLAENKYLLVVNAANIEKDLQHILQQNRFDANVHNQSDQWGLLAVQGPKVAELLQTLTSVNLADIPYYHFVVGTFAGIENVIISATGYTGAGGFEIYFNEKDGPAIWEAISQQGIKPAGLGARDTLRLEMGYCLYGHELSDTTNPIAAGLGWIVRAKNYFLGKEPMLAQKQAGFERILCGFTLTQQGIPRQGYNILNKKGAIIGEVSSGSISPVLNQGIGLGFVALDEAFLDHEIFIDIRNKPIPARIVKLPFI
ncbi:MAG: glycine cleavage system aminomethyltransferase GcvT [Chitinophagales bacterium]|nr:glycine cleavage system aminomethyltransferase GcvT [Bacteroidota bacterium]MCB9042969.1 glycine cleavage system aminomethyltransferase GcvT [Chitinophagales bacterium]